MLVVFCIFLIPILYIIGSIFLGFSDNFYHIYDNLLFEYSINSIFLVFGVSILVTILGVSTAWLVTFFNFYGKKFFQWALILPLAVPSYLLAYVFTEFFEFSGTANNILRYLLNTESDVIFFPNIRTIWGAITVFSFTLYPYVYMVARVAFMNIPFSIIEASFLLGKNSISTLFSLSIPLIRPAIIAGVTLVAMETLADFGAVQHFAIPTFTTGIFRTWTGLYDLTTALQLSSILLFIIFIFLSLERRSRNKIQFSNSESKNNSFHPIQLTSFKNAFAFFVCFIPVSIGFFLPVIELINWSTQVDTLISSKIIIAAKNTLYISSSATILTCFIALLINYIVRSFGLSQSFNDLLSIGYAVPGLILAVGITKMFTSIDFILTDLNIYITGSIFGLVLAYIIKSYAISNNVINSSFTSIPLSIDESAKTLKTNRFSILRKIHIPLLKTGLLTAFLLVMGELIKELPATLILRPFNFDTLSVSVYLLASEERMFEAAFPGLMIIIFGLIPIYFLNNLILSNSK